MNEEQEGKEEIIPRWILQTAVFLVGVLSLAIAMFPFLIEWETHFYFYRSTISRAGLSFMLGSFGTFLILWALSDGFKAVGIDLSQGEGVRLFAVVIPYAVMIALPFPRDPKHSTHVWVIVHLDDYLVAMNPLRWLY